MARDWIVLGGGIAGAALAYELQRQGLSVLLVEQSAALRAATRYSYGGLAYWSGRSDRARLLAAEGIALHRQLSDELGADTEFREIDLLLTVEPADDRRERAAQFAGVAIAPEVLDAQQAADLEPQLDPTAIAGALRFPHGHIHPSKTVEAYWAALQRLGGEVVFDEVWLDRDGGVRSPKQVYAGDRVAVCAGAASRELLRAIAIAVPVYFTRAECLETPPVELALRTLVMPARDRRLDLEAQSAAPENEALWDEPGHELAAPVLDPGAIQFRDGHLCLGQISRARTDQTPVDPLASEAALRDGIGRILPGLRNLPGTWRSCRIAFTSEEIPYVGAVTPKLHVFAGFGSALLIAPALARHFARCAAGDPGAISVAIAR